MSLAEYGYEITAKAPSEEWGPTDYKILHRGSGGGTFAKDSSQATMTYICEYYFIERFIDVVMGKTVKNGSSLSRSASTPDFDSGQGSLPEEHPYYYNFYASSAEVEPLGTSEQDPTIGPLWNKAKVTVVFRPPTFLVLGDSGNWTYESERFVTKTTEGQSEFLTKNGYFYWVGRTNGGQPVPLDIQPGQQVPGMRLAYTWHQIPVVPDANGNPDLGKVPNLDTIQFLLGNVNLVEFDGYPPGTVVFSAWSPKLVCPQAATASGYYWDITYTFGVRDYGPSLTPVYTDEHAGWNYAYDSAVLPGVWRLYTSNGTETGETMYGYQDLNELFAVGW